MTPEFITSRRSPLLLPGIATLELWLSFVVYDFAISDEINIFTNLGLGGLFVYMNQKSGQGLFGPQLNFRIQSGLLVTAFLSLGGYFFGWNPAELFCRMMAAYVATIWLQKTRDIVIARFNLDSGMPQPMIIEHQ